MIRRPIASVVAPTRKWNPRRSGNGEIAYIDLSSVDRETKSVAEPTRVLASEAPSRARQLVATGDVLVSTVRPNLNAVAVVPPELDGATASTGFTVLRPAPGQVNGRYLFHWVRSPEFVASMVQQATGASYPAVTDKIVKASTLPLPPIEQQRRVADVLDAADNLRAKRHKSLATLRSAINATFLHMFGDPVSNPMGWERATVGEAVDFLKYGPRFYDEPYASEGVRVARITDLDDSGRLDFASMPRYEVPAERRSKYLLSAGDIIFARSGSVGKVALLKADDPACIAGAYFVHMRFCDAITPEYARGVLTSPSVQTIVRETSRQAAQPNFSGPAIRELPMPIPPVERQREFEDRIRGIENVGHRLHQSRHSIEALCASLQQQAFRGEL